MLHVCCTRRWVEENPNQPVTAEVIGMLPAALESPTIFTVWTMVAVRCGDTALHTQG